MVKGPLGLSFGSFEVVQFAMFAGAMSAALLSAAWLIRQRSRMAAQIESLRDRVSDLTARLQNAEALTRTEGQRAIVWSDTSAKPAVIGSLPVDSGVPEERAAFLAFGRWLTAASAANLDAAVSGLREQAKPFVILSETQSGQPLEISGRTAGGSAVLRFLALGAERNEHARLKLDYDRMVATADTLRALIDKLPSPVWIRDRDGKITWSNAAYARSVDVADTRTAVSEQRELFAAQAREPLQRERAANGWARREMSAVVGGDRKLFAVTEATGPHGSAGLADISETDAMRAELNKTIASHRETLDQLNTAIAMFDGEGRMQFHNSAFQKLWKLDQAFVESNPDNALLLDRLRSEGRLPEQQDWRRWKETLLSAYRAMESQEHWWHLPDGQTLRVIANPHPKGGVTWVFENLTEKFDLESRYNTLLHVQGETLDNLAEAVVVFGSDGRVRLANPAFAHFFALPEILAGEGAHISRIANHCGDQAAGAWSHFVGAVTGFDEARKQEAGRLSYNGRSFAWSLLPLPNGQMMLSFIDITDTEQVERALTERNEALQKADRLKDEFVQHVSYELRSPLTNIIGFTELLQMGDTGPLNVRQAEYVDHIAVSSGALLTIINNVLDLATVDAGIMELDIAEIDIAETVQAAAEPVREKLNEHDIALDIKLPPPQVLMLADQARLRQILFNLLSNASNFAPAGSRVSLVCAADPNGWTFTVTDSGPGIDDSVRDDVFGRFSRSVRGSRRRGPGLGLSIVRSFVELHGGTVDIDSGPRGTAVTCRFPAVPRGWSKAAQ